VPDRNGSKEGTLRAGKAWKDRKFFHVFSILGSREERNLP
jgi:hypothetical protein